MIRHLIKVIWNRRKRNLLSIIEIFFSFIVLFVALCFVVHHMKNFIKPLGFDPSNVWYATFNWKDDDYESKKKKTQLAFNLIKSDPNVKDVSLSQSLLFAPSAMSIGALKDAENESKSESFYTFDAGDDFNKIMDIKIVHGRWFDEREDVQSQNSLVLMENASEELFGKKNSVGKYAIYQDEKYEIIGIIQDIKYGGDFAGQRTGFFRRLSFRDKDFELFSGEAMLNRILFKVKKGTAVSLERELAQKLNMIDSDWSFKVNQLVSLRNSANQQSLVFPGILMIICLFLIFNVTLGFFGVFWYSIHQRKAEIGIRRAVGSSTSMVYKFILGEAFIVTVFGIVLATIIVIQFPILKVIPYFDASVYLFSYLLSIGFFILLTTACALYPGIIASKIDPAEALHYE